MPSQIEVSEVIDMHLRKLYIGIPLVLCISILALYVFVKIVEILKRYVKERNDRKKKMKQTMIQSSSMLNPLFDNEIYDNSGAPVNPNAIVRDSTDITKTIADGFQQYVDYNEKLNTYFKNLRKMQAPDQIDKSVLNVKNDDW
jgi:hypothetical protein